MDPTELVERVRRRDPVALRQFDDAHRRRLTAFCRSRLHNPDDAEDCVQDTFVAALDRMDGLHSPEYLATWLTSFAKHKVMERNRRHRISVNRLADAAVLESDAADLADHGQDTAHLVGKREMLSVTAIALHSLTPQLRAVMTEVIRDPDLRGKALAERLNWPVRKTERELSRARDELTKAVGLAVVVFNRRGGCPELASLCRTLGVPEGRRRPLTSKQRRAFQRHVDRCSLVCRPLAKAAQDRGAWAVGPGLVLLGGAQREDDRKLVIAAEVEGLGVWQRGSEALTRLGARTAQLPGFSTAIRLAQGNPLAARAASAVTALAATAVAAMMLVPPSLSKEDSSHAATPSGLPSATASSALATPTAVPTFEATPPSVAAGPDTPPDGRVVDPSPSQGPSQGPGDGRFAVTLDATPLSAPKFSIGGVVSNLDARSSQVVWMKPGNYQLISGNVWTDARFTVTANGTVDYPQGVTYLGGRGTPQLIVRGFTLDVDATQMTSPLFAIEWVGANYDARRMQTIRVLPATYRIASGNVWTDARFTVTANGTVDYPQGVTYLSGRGTPRLVMRGFTVDVDATRLAATTFGIEWVGGTFDTHVVRTVRLLPATYRIASGSVWTNARFTVAVNGTVDYPQETTYLGGRGTAILTILTSKLPPQ